MNIKDIQKFCKTNLNPINIFKTIAFKLCFFRDNPNYFDPDGIWIFSGPQGSGKTLTACKCFKEILKTYPNALICSNLQVNGIDNEVIPFTDYSQLENLSNGTDGVIFLIDEIHVLWNSLESKNIPISEMACFCQMRKDRRVIIGTAQVYSRIAKPIREQLKYVVKCKNILGILQYNTIIDPTEYGDDNGECVGDIISRQLFFHSPDDYLSYDTLTKINRFDRKKDKKIKSKGCDNNVSYSVRIVC